MRLRLALTLSGAVSLGAYEAGVLAALLMAIQSLEGDIVIDVIAGASAGAITGLLAARSLLRGANPVELMTKAWVERDDLKDLLSHDLESPLSSSVLSAMATDLLGPTYAGGVPDGPFRQNEKIQLSFALTNLQGLAYRIPSLQRTTPIEATTYLDWVDFTLSKDDPAATYVDKAELALASGANALGFPPKLLDRTGDEETLLKAGITNFPSSGHYWYTDGGTVDNEPLGRTIDFVNGIKTDDARLFLLVGTSSHVPRGQYPLDRSEAATQLDEYRSPLVRDQTDSIDLR